MRQHPVATRRRSSFVAQTTKLQPTFSLFLIYGSNEGNVYVLALRHPRKFGPQARTQPGRASERRRVHCE